MRVTQLDLRPIPSAASLARLRGADVAGALAQAAAEPDPANRFMRMFQVLQATGQDALALEMQARALERCCLYRIAGPAVPALRLLALMGPGTMLDNAPLDFLLEGSDVRLDLLYLLPGAALPAELPEHDVAIVALAESQKSRPLLARIEELIALWPRPVLNHPQGILRCARDRAWQVLAAVPGLLVPQTRRLAREELRGAGLPCTIRPVDTQAGKGLERIDSPDGLAAYLASHPEPWFYVSDFVDCAGADGLYRKLRIALIDGRPYICHLAISAHWIVHYLPAGMEASAAKRAEEATLMQAFDIGFAVHHQQALQAIATGLGLDYVVIDCAQTRDGRLLLFEADIRGWIHATDPPALFPYKPAVMQRAFDAFRAMLLARAAAR